MRSDKTFSDYFRVIFAWRKFIIKNVLLITLFAIVLSFIITPQYTSVTTILPPSSESESMFGLLGGGLASNLASLSRLGGGKFPGMMSPSDLYAAILKSGTIKSAIINRFNLKKEFKAKTMYDASKGLEKITEIGVTPEGIISVAITYKNKYLATDIANAYVEELDKFNTETSMTMGKKYRIFIEKRLLQVTDSLTLAENALREFQEKYKTVSLEEEVKNAIEAVVKLKSEIIVKEAEKNAIAASSSLQNPYLINMEREIQALKNQLNKVEFNKPGENKNGFGVGFAFSFNQLPELTFKYAQLIRDVKVGETVYELLMEQYEQAKIMELKDTPTIQVLDRASPPEKRSFPRRTAVVILAIVLSLIGSIPMIFFYEYLNDILKNPTHHKLAVDILVIISNDFSKIKNYLHKKFKR